LFFTKGEPTKDVWYYHMQLPEGMKQYTKGKPIKHNEFDVVREWWNNREENGFAHKVSIEQIQERNYNLDFKNPNVDEKAETLSSVEIIAKIDQTEQKVLKILEMLKKQ
jgi:type I restriction enzyme M protein